MTPLKQKRYIASVSFGKDSLAMLILILKNKLPLDEVVFFNTGAEFSCIYLIRDKVVKYLTEKGIKYTELKPKRPFFDTMYNYPHMTRKGTIKNGYGWCGGRCRRGTTEKITAIDKYCKNDFQYIGIAFDEEERYQRLTKNKLSPLYNNHITEQMALDMCHNYGIKREENGVELYDILDRVSCWCCRNKNLKELKNYKTYLLEYYNKLIELEKLNNEPMKKPKYLKERFN